MDKDNKYRIAFWGDQEYYQALSQELKSYAYVDLFTYSVSYAKKQRELKADIFLVFISPRPNRTYHRGCYIALDLRAMFDYHQPIILCSFQQQKSLFLKWDLESFLQIPDGSNNFLRLPFTRFSLLASIKQAESCEDTLLLKPLLLKSGYFDKLKHDLNKLTSGNGLYRILKRTLSRYEIEG